MEYIDIAPIARMAGSVRLPGSKSISNRTLLLAALARGSTRVRGLLAAEDTERMIDALGSLGIRIVREGDTEALIEGAAGAIPVKRATLFLGNAGTAFRPLTAVLAFSGGSFELSGVSRMHERPIGDLVDALRALGADISYVQRDGFPPLRIGPGSVHHAGRVAIRGEISSQFLTALLMALPVIGGGTVDVEGDLISKPYIDITLSLMARFGVVVEREAWQRFRVPAASYTSPGTMLVEGDASSASYFLAAGAIAGGRVRVAGAGRPRIQGDVRFADALAQMGASVSWGDD